MALVRGWPPSRWLVAAATGLFAALVMGVPTGVLQTPFYTRMTPVRWWDYPVWAISAVLVGLTAATYVRAPTRPTRAVGAGRTIGGGLLSTFAIGCPICNKLIVALIGVSGALNYWAPLQPILGGLAVVGLAVAFVVRLRGEHACAVPPAGAGLL